MIFKEEMKMKTMKVLDGACRLIARTSRLSQLKPEATGMTIEEVSEFIKLAVDKASAKYEKMSLIDITIDMVREVVSAEGGEDASDTKGE